MATPQETQPSDTQTQTTSVEWSSIPKHQLQSTWAFWFDDHAKDKENRAVDFKSYQSALKCLGSFNTLEDFWRHFSYLTNPDSFPRDVSIYLVRDGAIPAWESYPEGGCWILRVRKRNTLIDRMWEELTFAAVAELFAVPDIVCIGLSTRTREDMLSIWNRDNTNGTVRFTVGEKLRVLLNLDETTNVEYKTFKSAIKDGSSFKNAKNYGYGPAPVTYNQQNNRTYHNGQRKNNHGNNTNASQQKQPVVIPTVYIDEQQAK